MKPCGDQPQCSQLFGVPPSAVASAEKSTNEVLNIAYKTAEYILSGAQSDVEETLSSQLRVFADAAYCAAFGASLHS